VPAAQTSYSGPEIIAREDTLISDFAIASQLTPMAADNDSAKI
jgi:hypothetical protein